MVFVSEWVYLCTVKIRFLGQNSRRMVMSWGPMCCLVGEVHSFGGTFNLAFGITVLVGALTEV